MANSAPLQDISFQKFEWSWHWPFKVTKIKGKHSNELPLYAFLLMFNSNTWHTSAPLQDTALPNLSDLKFDLSVSLKSKCDCVIGLSIYGFHWYIYRESNSMSISHRLAVKATQNVFSCLLSLGPYYEKSQVNRVTSKWPWMKHG